MNAFVDSYLKLLIKQYYYKPKAKGEISTYAQEGAETFAFFNGLIPAFDVDKAQGAQLDIIGRLVGIPRLMSSMLAKKFFGFRGGSDAQTFADKFYDVIESAPFKDKFARIYSDLQLSDDDYRFFIKAKIAINNASAFIATDEFTSIQSIISYLFGDEAYVVDNQDMSITLYVSPSINVDRLNLVNILRLLPKPQTVNYKFIIKAPVTKTFGFKNNPNSKGFANKFKPSTTKIYFAEKIIL